MDGQAVALRPEHNTPLTAHRGSGMPCTAGSLNVPSGQPGYRTRPHDETVVPMGQEFRYCPAVAAGRQSHHCGARGLKRHCYEAHSGYAVTSATGFRRDAYGSRVKRRNARGSSQGGDRAGVFRDGPFQWARHPPAARQCRRRGTLGDPRRGPVREWAAFDARGATPSHMRGLWPVKRR
jgi:hypothetical protein